MLVRFAMLGLLRERPDYGYRLKHRFDERVGSVWHLNIGQVYQTLHALEHDGLIEAVEAADGTEDLDHDDEQYPARRLYNLTPEGVRSLESWLDRPPIRPRPVRDEMLIRLLVLMPGRQVEAIERIQAQEHMYKRHLSDLNTRKRKFQRTNSREVVVGKFGLEAAIMHTEAHLKWLEYCRLHLADTMAHSSGEEGDPS